MKNNELNRLKKVLNRAESGDELTIAFFGGSITQGARASKDEFCYAHRVYDYFKANFKNSTFNYVNAGIGATSSFYGCARVKKDVLIYQPDLVIIDFSVNDEKNNFFKETFEGVLRSILYSPSNPAVIVLNNVFYDTGESTEKYHNEIADYYNIPHVSIKDSIYRDLCLNKIKRVDISPDGLHPNDLGHQLVADQIIKLIKTCKDSNININSDREKILTPLTDNKYENSKIINITNTSPELDGFKPDTNEKLGHLDIFKNGWIGRKKGDNIRFNVICSSLAIQYRKTISKPSPIATAVIDNDDDHPIILDGNFDEDWGDCLYLLKVFEFQNKAKHDISINITSSTLEDKLPFYLTSLIIS